MLDWTWRNEKYTYISPGRERRTLWWRSDLYKYNFLPIRRRSCFESSTLFNISMKMLLLRRLFKIIFFRRLNFEYFFTKSSKAICFKWLNGGSRGPCLESQRTKWKVQSFRFISIHINISHASLARGWLFEYVVMILFAVSEWAKLEKINVKEANEIISGV